MKQMKSLRSGLRYGFVLLLLAVVLWQPGLIGAVARGPVTADVQSRQRVEQQALSSTVRLNCERWTVYPDESGYDVDSRVAHATIVENRYLVTHNHFTFPFDCSSDNDAYSCLRIRTLSGKSICVAPMASVSVVAQDEQTLILDLGTRGAAALRSVPGLPLADPALYRPKEILPGATVAQVDWDGRQTRIDWTTILAVVQEDGVTKLILADDVAPGASGGGVYLNGFLVANNWTSIRMLDDEGKEIGKASSAALFSAELMGDLMAHGFAANTDVSFAGEE